MPGTLSLCFNICDTPKDEGDEGLKKKIGWGANKIKRIDISASIEQNLPLRVYFELT